MISSFGFHYNSAYNVEKARHKPNPTACRCSVCVDFNHDDPRLKGYDPDKMYYRFSAIADKLGIDFTRDNQANTTARRRILAAYEKSQRKSRKVNARITKVADSLGIKVVDGKATNAADKKLLFSELKLRDRQWLLTGKPPAYTQEANARPLQKEKDIADKLSSRGIKCEFRATSLEDSKRTSDIFILADKLKKPYEFKTPTGAGKQTIYHQFESAAGQAKCMVLDISKLHENWGEERVKSEVSKKINWHYKTKDKKDWQFDEVRIINSKGEMKIIKKARPPV